MDRADLDAALAKIEVDSYLDREGVPYSESYGTSGLQLNLHECPACGEAGRKTYIGAETGLGKCFHGSCGVGFNKFKLIKAVSKLAGPALDAHITAVAREQGWMPKKARKTIERGELKLPSKLVPLPVEGQNLQYLQDRGVTLDSCRHFELAYCHKGWWTYTVGGAEKFVSYDERVIIPIADLAGTLVSFQGRDVSGKREPKYLFPAGFAVAGSHLYGAHHFEQGVHRHLIVGEGAFDAIAIHQAVKDQPSCDGMLATATFGMHLSGGPDGQIARFVALKDKGLTTVTFMWDGERKAVAMAVKAGLELASMGITVRVAVLPAGKDPNEVPAETVRQAIFQATKLTRLSAIRLLQQAVALAA
jgi:DNA primase